MHIHKRFGSKITVKYYPNVPAKECRFKREVRIEGATKNTQASTTAAQK
ncbi:MAG: hypothetical protein QXD70_05230 [Candidatus Bathyarchaeia archaeon]